MRSYYDIIGRPKKEPTKERLCSCLQILLSYLWIVIAVVCAIYTIINTKSIINGLLALVMAGILGTVVFPVYAFALKEPFAITVCCVYITLIFVLIILEFSKRKPTKKEQIEDLQLQILGKEFEAKYPRAVEIKNEYNQLQKSHKQAKESVIAGLKATSIDEINADFRSGLISEAERDKLIESYQICKFNASKGDFFEKVNQEIGDHLKEELAQYIAEFEGQK